MDIIDFSPNGIFTAFGLFWVLVVSPISFYWFVIRDHPRPKPDNYTGRFEMPDGHIVHVSRMPSGEFWACTDERPGVMPQPIGYVTGRELTQWHKLSSTPDGKDSVARPN